MGITLQMIHLSVALLICDVPMPVIVSNYGDYEKLFSNLLHQANEAYSASTLPVELKITAFDVTQGQYPQNIDDFSAYILTGSKFSAYEDINWIKDLKKFMQRVDSETHAKVVGICFGHQILAEALGGKVTKNPAGWEIGWTEMNLNPAGADVLKSSKTVLRIHQMHQDHVSVVPPRFEVISSTEKCPVQMMARGERYLTIQGHPEFVPGVVVEIVKARRASKVFSEEVADLALSQVDNMVDNIWFGQKMLGFMVGTQGLEVDA
ncbi:hypothetical protein PhCBS80983_g01003 [Powellomyces hirtus]|uniref:Glutamine amidotransferase domain-containing protein n=1 Tax=Powellomyces hirtus TaxID=109895 RepID=A0A507ED24_9FUNG|nr:class I glutamine amidotransferase-like protein [Powellomyces hirtus]TPX61616.1 hypothetical protein PhCBS80983_g01003 [Powellomyces hirtus]